MVTNEEKLNAEIFIIRRKEGNRRYVDLNLSFPEEEETLINRNIIEALGFERVPQDNCEEGWAVFEMSMIDPN